MGFLVVGCVGLAVCVFGCLYWIRVSLSAIGMWCESLWLGAVRFWISVAVRDRGFLFRRVVNLIADRDLSVVLRVDVGVMCLLLTLDLWCDCGGLSFFLGVW